MFGRFARGWELVKQSWQVLKKDKELLLFPVLSGIACLLVVASFLMPLLVAPDAVSNWLDKVGDEKGATADKVLAFVVLFLFYFLNYFVIVFFNCALASCAIIRFKGGNPTLGDGMRASCARLPQILAWAFVAATVGLLLRIIEERVEGVGRFMVGLLGAAWSIVTYLVIPVIAVEKVGPITAARRSATLVKQTWGESLAGNLSIGLISFLAAIPGILLIAGGFALGANTQSWAVPITLIIFGVLALLAQSILFAALKQVFLAGVYVFAADGEVPSGFSESSLRETFRSKN